jgi:hypothetical protein
MENLKIRITLTNSKGWKETKDVSLSYYKSQKEKGADALSEIIDHLVEDYSTMKEKTNKLKIEDIKWRP